MKQILPIIGIFVVTFLLALGGNMAILWLRPATPAGSAPVTESGPAAATDSTSAPGATVAARDTLPHVAAVDTVRLMADTLAQVRAQLAADLARVQSLEQALRRQNGQSDSLKAKQRSDFAKMIEGMGADEAAKILQNLSDTETRQVLLAVKKRQAGKILGAMEPRRAARLMN